MYINAMLMLEHSLKCVAACKHCNGEAFENSELSDYNVHESNDSELEDAEDEPDEEVDLKYSHRVSDDGHEFEQPWIGEEIVK